MLMTNFEGLKKAASSCITRIEQSLSGERKIPSSENPYRIARLLRSVVANGNDRTAIFLTNGSQEIDFNILCRVVLAHARPNQKDEFTFHGATDLLDIFSPRSDVKRVTQSSAKNTTLKYIPAKKFDPTINREFYELGGTDDGDGSDLLMLLVDFSYLLPLSETDVRSEMVWTLIKKVIMPIIDYLNNLSRPMSDTERVVNGALVDFYDNILSKIDGHGLLEALLAEQYRNGENMIEDARDDLRFMKDCIMFKNSLSSRTRSAIDRVILRVEGNSYLIDMSK